MAPTDSGDMVFDGLEFLSEEDCLALLATKEIGRVAVSIGALPAVFPVNYALLDGDVVFLTAEGTKLSAAVRNAVVAFEVDHLDPSLKEGWSVLVVGRSRQVEDPQIANEVRALRLQPWARGARPHIVSIHPEFVSGRKIVPDQDDGGTNG